MRSLKRSIKRNANCKFNEYRLYHDDVDVGDSWRDTGRHEQPQFSAFKFTQFTCPPPESPGATPALPHRCPMRNESRAGQSGGPPQQCFLILTVQEDRTCSLSQPYPSKRPRLAPSIRVCSGTHNSQTPPGQSWSPASSPSPDRPRPASWQVHLQPTCRIVAKIEIHIIPLIMATKP
jgi:hypothetical protein